MQTITDVCKEGLDVKMDSVICHTHKATHENCRGCVSEQACKEYVIRFGQYVTAELKETGDIPEDWEFTDEE
jgi:hypothetical protein